MSNSILQGNPTKKWPKLTYKYAIHPPSKKKFTIKHYNESTQLLTRRYKWYGFSIILYNQYTIFEMPTKKNIAKNYYEYLAPISYQKNDWHEKKKHRKIPSTAKRASLDAPILLNKGSFTCKSDTDCWIKLSPAKCNEQYIK